MSRLDEIRDRLIKATPGPWISDDFSVKTRDDANYGYPPTDGVICGLSDGEYIENGNYKNDASFIANSITDIEYLLNEIEKMRAENPNFWDLYDRFENKIADNLKLKDEVKRLTEENNELYMDIRVRGEYETE